MKLNFKKITLILFSIIIFASSSKQQITGNKRSKRLCDLPIILSFYNYGYKEFFFKKRKIGKVKKVQFTETAFVEYVIQNCKGDVSFKETTNSGLVIVGELRSVEKIDSCKNLFPQAFGDSEYIQCRKPVIDGKVQIMFKDSVVRIDIWDNGVLLKGPK